MSRTAKYGRWLPEDRYSLDQVPCMLVEGDTRTYHFKGANEHVWVAGSGKGDEGKRFCTLQLIVRFKNGDKTKMFVGQPWPKICFRGQGIRITQKEKDAWEPGVHVRFQPKAWYCEATCLKHATERLPAITASARSAHRESVLIVDNLHGQTTPEYINMCWVRSKMKVHLLPAGVTDMLQLIDAGFGYLVKYYMGEYHSEWMAKETEVDGKTVSNVELWQTGLEMWRRRVHMTKMLKRAYHTACLETDFEAIAAKLGMNLTIDGSGDDEIKIQGLPDYSFTDTNGGSDGGGSEADEKSDSESDVDADESTQIGDDEDSIISESDDDDEPDDTAELDAAAALAITDATAPEGFRIVTPAPEQGTLQEENTLIGKAILRKWSGAPIPASKFGWYRGKVMRRASQADMRRTAGVNFIVKFSNEHTGMVIPACEGGAKYSGKKATGEYPLDLTPETWGVDGTWVVLEGEEGAQASGSPPEGGGEKKAKKV